MIINCENCRKSFKAYPSRKRKFCSRRCATLTNRPSYKGGQRKHHGYMLLLNHSHPFSDSRGYIQEHRLVVEKQIGRYLHRWEVVHHINKIRDDNELKNLMAFVNERTHQKFERLGKVKKEEVVFDGKITKGYSKSSQ